MSDRSAILDLMSYRSTRLSREARNERRRLHRLGRFSPAMRDAFGAIRTGETPTLHQATKAALLRRDVIEPDGDGYRLTRRGEFIALMSRVMWRGSMADNSPGRLARAS